MKVIVFLILLSTSCLYGQSLEGIRICIDPGHGGTSNTDFYRVGIHGEREEWINLRVAKYLEQLLLKEGALVKMTREEDVFVELNERAKIAKDFSADLFVSIHHNGTADTSVNYPVIYFHGSKNENLASVSFSELLVKELNQKLFGQDGSEYSIVSDFVIFPNRGAAVLRGTYGMPAVIGEASYFTNPTEETKLKSLGHNKREAEAYCEAIKQFFASSRGDILDMGSVAPNLLQIAVNQEALRMDQNATSWSSKIDTAVAIIETQDIQRVLVAKDLLSEVLRLFPDNYRLTTVYENYLEILKILNDSEQYNLFNERFKNYVHIIN